MCRNRANCYAYRRRCRRLCCCRQVDPQHHPVKWRREISVDLCGVPRERVHLQRTGRLQISEQSSPRRSLVLQWMWIALGPEETIASLGPSTGPSRTTAGQTLKVKVLLHFCLSAGCRARQNALRPAMRFRANPSSAKQLSCCKLLGPLLWEDKDPFVPSPSPRAEHKHDAAVSRNAADPLRV